MQGRTDLALEAADIWKDSTTLPPDVERQEENHGSVIITRLKVGEDGAQAWGRPAGTYITAQLPPLTDDEKNAEETALLLAEELKSLLPSAGTVLVVGIGNESITPDALGPNSARMVLATRHICGEIARSMGLEGLRPVAVLSPGVLGNTGVESGELAAGLCARIRPDAVIAVDALAARSLSRLGCTVQMSDTGISPGSGVGNNRRALNRELLGIPVIALGIPTVVDAETIVRDLCEDCNDATLRPHGTAMMVTPREVDLMISRASRLIAMTINSALQPDYSPLELIAAAV